MSNDLITVCANCLYVIRSGPDSAIRVWYQYFCAMEEPHRKIDYVTGELTTRRVHCRDKNKGTCPDFREGTNNV